MVGAKTGGRKKGVPNKATQRLEDLCKKLKCDPFEILLHFAAGNWKQLGYDNECYFKETATGDVKMGFVIPPELRQKSAKDACEYLLPKRKALEIDGDGEEIGFAVVIKDYTGKKND